MEDIHEDGQLTTTKQRGAYDFETWDWVHPYCYALVWGAKGERKHHYARDASAKRPRALAANALEMMHRIQEPEGVAFWYAHNGGKFDVLALTEAAQFTGWSALFRSSSDGRVIEATFKPPGATKKERGVRVRDSMCLVGVPLKHKKRHLNCLGECQGCAVCDFNLSKAVFEDEDYAKDVRDWNPERLMEGCIKDAELVLELIDRIEGFAQGHGAKGVGLTFSQTALMVLKAWLEDRGIVLPSHGGSHMHRDSEQRWNEWCEAGFYGGRVEVFHHHPVVELTEVDVTSSYPWAMTQPLPWQLIGKMPDERGARAVLEGRDGLEGIVEARVHVPRKMRVPPLPVRLTDEVEDFPDGAMYFPTGTFKGRWPANELRYARRLGVQVEPLEAVAYTRATPFATFIREIFSLKAKAKGSERLFYKLVMNSIYGKFSQRPLREQIRMCATPEEARERIFEMEYADARSVGLEPRHGGRCMAWDTLSWPKHTHYALAGYITAHSRILLHKGLSLAGDTLCYCDTDSIHAHLPALARLAPLLGTGLGQFKTEIPRMHGEYFAPKIYYLVEPLCPTGLKTGKNCERHSTGYPHKAAKGFPVTADAFAKLINGETVTRETMRLLKSQLAHDGTFQRVSKTKSWKGISRKRKPLPSGATVPWTYDELASQCHLKALSPHVSARLPFPLAEHLEREREYEAAET